MSHAQKLNILHAAIRRFRRDEGGNIAIMFAAMLVPFIGFVGAAIDFTRASSARTSMISALDSTALMISKEIGGNTISDAELKAKANAYFNALYKEQDVYSVTLDTSFASDPVKGSTVRLSGSGKMDTIFMRVLGYRQMDLGASTATSWGSTRMRVAMALDVTGSMNSNNKLKAMIDAAKELVKTLEKDVSHEDDVRISVVPFAMEVNVGTENRNASWITWEPWNKGESLPGNCKAYTIPGKGVSAGCKGTSNAYNQSMWNGCVSDRDMPYDTTGDPASVAKFPAAASGEPDSVTKINTNNCPSKLLPMTSIGTSSGLKAVNDRIDTLIAVGGTNQVVGTAWAWLTMLPNSPFPTPPKDPSKRYTDVLIILSDGQNTYNRFNGEGRFYEPNVDARQELLCKNIRATSKPENPVVIYTIQVNTTGDPESAVLKSCANPGNFFSTTSSEGIAEIFRAIARTLGKLRLAS